MMGNAVLEHYIRHWGKFADFQEFEGESAKFPSLKVFEWERSDEGVWTYSSVGLSERAMPETAPEHRVEIFAVTRRRDMDGLADLLVKVAEVPWATHQPLQAGDTVALREAVPGSKTMRRVWLASPLGEDDGFEFLDSGLLHVRILMLVPIHEPEFRFLRKHGDDELWQAFADEKIVLSDFARGVASSAFGVQ